MDQESKDQWVARAAQQLGLDPEDILEIVVVFFHKTQSDLIEIAAACDTGTIDTITRLAHGIKGAARNMACTEIGDKAEALESYAHAGDITGVRAELAVLSQVVESRKDFVG